MRENSGYRSKRAFGACLTILLIVVPVGCTKVSSPVHIAAFQNGDVKHGEYLSKVFACQECHTVRQVDGIHFDEKLLLAGGLPFTGPDGPLVHSAKRHDCQSVPGQVLDSLIRGRMAYKFTMPTQLYNGMSADDMRDLIAYLKTLHPMLQHLPDNSLPAHFVISAPTKVVPIPEHEPAAGTIERGSFHKPSFTAQQTEFDEHVVGCY